MIQWKENLCYGVDSAFCFPSDDALNMRAPFFSRRSRKAQREKPERGMTPWQHPPSLSTTAKPRHPITGPALTAPLDAPFVRRCFNIFEHAVSRGQIITDLKLCHSAHTNAHPLFPTFMAPSAALKKEPYNGPLVKTTQQKNIVNMFRPF